MLLNQKIDQKIEKVDADWVMRLQLYLMII